MAVLPAFFKYRVFDLQICLWLTAASLYRGLDRFEDARISIAEADRVLEALIRTEDGVGSAKSRIFLKGVDYGKVGLGGAKKGVETGKWGLVGSGLRRQMADIAFERCLLRERKFNKQKTETEALEKNVGKYLSPVARADLEYKAMKKKGEKAGGKSFYKRGNASNISMPTGISPLILHDDAYVDSIPKLIDDFLAIVEMDGEHLPTLVHLGGLYVSIGDYGASEYWLERGLRRGKGRGCGGGRGGLGGMSSCFGVRGWKLLERVMRESGREEVGDECKGMVKDSERRGRGFECLERLLAGEEW
jgi:hypothetical protein